MSDETTETETPFKDQDLKPETDAVDGQEREQQDDTDTFDRAYVEKLRSEAAEGRTARKDAEATLERVQTAYRDLAVSSAVAGVLVDPSDLSWSDDYLDSDGLVDAEKVQQAATALLEQKPHLGRVVGDVGQGFKGEQAKTVDLAGMLRAGA